MHNTAATTASADVLNRVAELIELTKDLDYDPSQESWICGDHGVAECADGVCVNLPWPQPNADDLLSEFMRWSEREFLREARPYDEGHVPEMPEEAFRAYTVCEWPVGALLEAIQPPR